MDYHKPVLLEKCITLLQLKPDGVYVDVTFGGGGHSKEILKHLTTGHLYSFDQDTDAHQNEINSPKFTLIASNFRHLQKQLRFHKITEVDGVLADLGISSHQIDEASRGFSLRFEGPLDMRMNQKQALSAKTVVNEFSEDDLFKIFKDYGELNRAWHITQAIVSHRANHPINTTEELKSVLTKFAPNHKQGQFWAKVFQGIRIAVNDEMGALHDMLLQSAEILKPQGRLVIMSYHSLEDRPVKNFMKTGNFKGEPKKDFYGNLIRPLTPVTRKPIIADEEELQANSRSRSVRLRAAEKNKDGTKD